MTEKKLIKPAAPKAVKPATQDERGRALAAAMAQIEKQFGKGAIMRLGDDRSLDVALQPTGIMGLDIATGGGLPYGRICEIYGQEASGKTTLALYVIVVDLVAALVSKAEIEGEIGDAHVGLQSAVK